MSLTPESTAGRWLDTSLVSLANTFLYAYLLDGLLSLADTALAADYGITLLAAPRAYLALGVFGMALVWLPAVLVFTRLPRWLLFFLALSTLWLNAGGQPLNLWFDFRQGTGLMHVLIGAQLGIGCLTLLNIRRRFGHWWISAADLRTGPWRIGRWFGQWLPQASLLVVLGALYLPFLYLSLVQSAAEDYVFFSNDGVHLRDVEFATPDGRSVRLVGMMHVGETRHYEAIMESFAGPATIVLTEGVSDDQHLLGDPPASGNLVRPGTGITLQPPVSFFLDAQRVTAAHLLPADGRTALLNADLDVSELSPNVLEFVRSYRDVLIRTQAAGFDRLDWLLVLGELSAAMDPTVLRDLIETRNAAVLEHLASAVEHYQTVIVPWGALHMPGISQALLARGFEPVRARDHPVLSWRSVYASLASRPSRSGDE